MWSQERLCNAYGGFASSWSRKYHLCCRTISSDHGCLVSFLETMQLLFSTYSFGSLQLHHYIIGQILAFSNPSWESWTPLNMMRPLAHFPSSHQPWPVLCTSEFGICFGLCLGIIGIVLQYFLIIGLNIL